MALILDRVQGICEPLMKTTLLSVLIDTYNHERYIEQAVVSAIEQDFPADDYEIVVVDDGSTDRTPEIVRRFAPRVRLIQKKNGGQASAFNAAFPELSGEVVAFLDGDDWFAPGKLTVVMNALEHHPEAAAVGHGHYKVYEETNEIYARVPPSEFLHLNTVEAARRAFYGLVSSLLMGALTVRKEILRKVIPIPEQLVFCGDNPIAVASLVGGAYVIDQPLFYYRHHSTNLCAPMPGEELSKMRSRFEIQDKMFRLMEPLLANLHVSPDAAAAFIYPNWIESSRYHLSRGVGRRLDTFRTEMRSLRYRRDRSVAGNLLAGLRYPVVSLATMLLPPRVFYNLSSKAGVWYEQRILRHIRERLGASG
jgi:glycosyltransferase involved in cell wall biosynthesis